MTSVDGEFEFEDGHEEHVPGIVVEERITGPLTSQTQQTTESFPRSSNLPHGIYSQTSHPASNNFTPETPITFNRDNYVSDGNNTRDRYAPPALKKRKARSSGGSRSAAPRIEKKKKTRALAESQRKDYLWGCFYRNPKPNEEDWEEMAAKTRSTVADVQDFYANEAAKTRESSEAKIENFFQKWADTGVRPKELDENSNTDGVEDEDTEDDGTDKREDNNQHSQQSRQHSGLQNEVVRRLNGEILGSSVQPPHYPQRENRIRPVNHQKKDAAQIIAQPFGDPYGGQPRTRPQPSMILSGIKATGTTYNKQQPLSQSYMHSQQSGRGYEGLNQSQPTPTRRVAQMGYMVPGSQPIQQTPAQPGLQYYTHGQNHLMQPHPQSPMQVQQQYVQNNARQGYAPLPALRPRIPPTYDLLSSAPLPQIPHSHPQRSLPQPLHQNRAEETETLLRDGRVAPTPLEVMLQEQHMQRNALSKMEDSCRLAEQKRAVAKQNLNNAERVRLAANRDYEAAKGALLEAERMRAERERLRQATAEDLRVATFYLNTHFPNHQQNR